MQLKSQRARVRVVAIAGASCAALAAAAFVPAQVGAAPAPSPKFAKHAVVAGGLDNPRQLNVLPNGDLLVAEAGRGAKNPGPSNCDHGMCVGKTGKVTRIHRGHARHVMTGLLSGAGRDGSFAVGSDGASKRPGGAYFSIVTLFPPELPARLPGHQAGKLMRKGPHGDLRAVANISGLERRQDPDGEGFDSNPYSVLALKHRVLVADAAGDYIAQVRHGKVSVWAVMPEYGKRVDAVPTVISKGADGNIYVGELHSEMPGKAKVWKLDRRGNFLRSWGGFTTVTGVTRGANGTLYVSELFGGNCEFKDIPDCFPGRVVEVKPNGHRGYRKVPFPAGVAVKNGRVHVAAFSIAPGSGFGGNPAWSGQIWRIFR